VYDTAGVCGSWCMPGAANVHVAGDHSHKINDKVMLGGERPYAGTWSVSTEAKQCRAYRLTEGEGHHEVRKIEEGIEKSYEMFRLGDLETYTVDNAAKMDPEALLPSLTARHPPNESVPKCRRTTKANGR